MLPPLCFQWLFPKSWLWFSDQFVLFMFCVLVHHIYSFQAPSCSNSSSSFSAKHSWTLQILLSCFELLNRVVSYLSSLLEGDDEMLQVVAAEALYLIAEIGSVEKFTGETNIFDDFFITDPSIPTNKELPEKKLKDDIRQLVQGKVPSAFCCPKVKK